MDGKGFFLGLIAAVVLFLLWKKEGASFNFQVGATPQPGTSPNPNREPTGGCAGCSASPSYAASPFEQAVQAFSPGQITPGTPPLQSVTGTGSFYSPVGPTPDTNFWSLPVEKAQQSTTASATAGVGTYANVPGSATTPANQVPVRAMQRVAPTSQLGFQQRYNVAGVPRTSGARFLIQ